MKINEVAKKYELSNDTLRYYEKVGLIGPITKNHSGIRDYNDMDLNQIEFVKCMRGANVPIEALRRYVSLYKVGDTTINERRKILTDQLYKVDEQLKELIKAQEKLKIKIKLYDQQLLEKNI